MSLPLKFFLVAAIQSPVASATTNMPAPRKSLDAKLPKASSKKAKCAATSASLPLADAPPQAAASNKKAAAAADETV